MSLFGLYRTLRENQEKKNNFLATVVEGPDSGSRLLFSEIGKVLVTIISRRGSAPREIGTIQVFLEVL